MLVLLYFQRFSHAQRVQFCCFIYMYIFLFFSCCFASAACYRVSVLRAPLCFTSRRPFFIHKQNECGVSDRDTLTNDRDGDSKTARVLRERERQRELAQSSWETCVCVCVCVVTVSALGECFVYMYKFESYVCLYSLGWYACMRCHCCVFCVCVCARVCLWRRRQCGGSNERSTHNARNGKTGATATAAATTTTRGSI